jgi:hypothetical protein
MSVKMSFGACGAFGQLYGLCVGRGLRGLWPVVWLVCWCWYNSNSIQLIRSFPFKYNANQQQKFLKPYQNEVLRLAALVFSGPDGNDPGPGLADGNDPKGSLCAILLPPESIASF